MIFGLNGVLHEGDRLIELDDGTIFRKPLLLGGLMVVWNINFIVPLGISSSHLTLKNVSEGEKSPTRKATNKENLNPWLVIASC